MRQLCIIGSERSSAGVLAGTEGSLELEGLPFRYGVIETDDLSFDADAGENAEKVFLRVRAFSCNYRDRALILSMSNSAHKSNYYVIGSEFVAEVLAVGRDVTALAPGDRVIANGAYPDSGVDGVDPGLPGNHGSRELQILHRCKLVKIPDSMPDEVAAGFTIGAQTAYSMIRRLNLKDDDKVLVTSAKSNTSLFAIAALRQRGLRVFGLSTSESHRESLSGLGLEDLFIVDPKLQDWSKDPRLLEVALEVGGFDAVLDPFADVYAGEMLDLMAIGSRYITCGVADQLSSYLTEAPDIFPINPTRFMARLLIKNISVIGNCLGLTSDLEAALADYDAQRLTVPVHAQVTQSETGQFFADSYLNKERFGKVVFHYA